MTYWPKHQPPLDSSFTQGRFAGKVAIVTGGCGGLGSGVTTRFLNDGAKVAVIDINEERAKIVIEDHLKEYKDQGSLEWFKADLSSRENCFKVVEEIKKHFGRIDFLVNTAVWFKTGGLDETEENWHKALMINVAAIAFMGQAVFPHMKENQNGGAIVNFSSITAKAPTPGRWSYGASKAGIEYLTKNMALDLSCGGKIRVNCVSPGTVWSPEVESGMQRLDLTREEYEARDVSACHILPRTGEVAEIAAAAAFLCSKDAGWVTGTVMSVDGGYSALGPEGLGKTNPHAYK